jgi:hypothetical protein
MHASRVAPYYLGLIGGRTRLIDGRTKLRDGRTKTYYGERLTLTFSAMQASRGFLVSGQAQHGFSFLPSGPAPERETMFQIRIESGYKQAESVPPKMKKISCLKLSLLGWRLHLKPECTFYGFKKTYMTVIYNKNLCHPDPDSAKCLDPDPDSVNPGPKRELLLV